LSKNSARDSRQAWRTAGTYPKKSELVYSFQVFPAVERSSSRWKLLAECFKSYWTLLQEQLILREVATYLAAITEIPEQDVWIVA